MAENPLTYQEIDAFSRLDGAGLSPWEVELICRLDDAVLAVRSGVKSNAGPKSIADALRTRAIKKQAEREARNGRSASPAPEPRAPLDPGNRQPGRKPQGA